MGCPTIDVSNEQLDKGGNLFAKFLKGVVIGAAVLSVAGYLGLIFVTISPEVEDAPEVKTQDGYPSMLVPAENSKDNEATWITEFKVTEEDEVCVETSTGIRTKCKTEGDKMIVSIDPGNDKPWPTYECRLCENTCTNCGNTTFCEPEGMCQCVVGCDCSATPANPSDQRYCLRDGTLDYGESPRAITTSGEFKFFAVVSDICFLCFALLILIAELNIEAFARIATLLTFWPVRCTLHLFVGVQLVNSTSTLELASNHNAVANAFALAGGWCLVFSGLSHLAFYGLFIRPWRPVKFCALCCLAVVIIIVPIGAVLGTGADSSDSGS